MLRRGTSEPRHKGNEGVIELARAHGGFFMQSQAAGGFKGPFPSL